MTTDKRARKKQARDQALAAREAALRQRRIARLLAGLLVVALVVGLALFSGGDEGDNDAAGEGPQQEQEEETEATACGAEAPETPEPAQFDSYEPLPEGDHRAVINTSCGAIEMDLLEGKAPESVASFIYLAEQGFFDGLIWHRVERNFVIQTGDPNGINGTEPDGPGYTVPDEFPEASSEFLYGSVGMANAGPGTTGSQFFVIVHDAEKSCDAKGELLKGNIENKPDDKRHYCPAGLQPLYSIFAQVDESSFEVLETIAGLETRGGNDPVEAVKPVENVYIESVEITTS